MAKLHDRRSIAGILVLVVFVLSAASTSCRPKEPPESRMALDCTQTDGSDHTFHRQYLLDLGAHRAWGDQAANGVFEIEVLDSSSGAMLHGESRAHCPPSDAESCRAKRVVSNDFDLRALRMTQTLWNNTGTHGREDGVVAEVLHFDCARIDLTRSTIARNLGD